ncbi:flagellin, partial [Clostridiales bacterium COT073_COT-073]
KELAVQSANGSNQDDDRKLIQKEVEQLKSEIDAIAEKTQFNKMKLLAGKEGNAGDPLEMTFQVGANKAGAAKAEEITIKISNVKVVSLFGVDADTVSLATASGAKNLMSSVEGAIIKLATSRADLGAVQNRLEHTIKNLDNAVENLTASESRIRHTDMAKEMMEFTRTNILNQAAQAMLAQANQLPQGVLQLLR